MTLRPVRISENFVPISEFKAQSAGLLRKLKQSGAPLVVTSKGRPAGVLLSPEAYDQLTEQARFIAAVTEGLADADAGRTHPHSEVVRRVKRRFAAFPR